MHKQKAVPLMPKVDTKEAAITPPCLLTGLFWGWLSEIVDCWASFPDRQILTHGIGGWTDLPMQSVSMRPPGNESHRLTDCSFKLLIIFSVKSVFQRVRNTENVLLKIQLKKLDCSLNWWPLQQPSQLVWRLNPGPHHCQGAACSGCVLTVQTDPNCKRKPNGPIAAAEPSSKTFHTSNRTTINPERLRCEPLRHCTFAPRALTIARAAQTGTIFLRGVRRLHPVAMGANWSDLI